MSLTTFVALSESVPAGSINNLSPGTDSPIRILSIKPAVRRGHRRMPMPPTSSTDPSGDQVVHIGRYNVLQSRPEPRKPKQPILATDPRPVDVVKLMSQPTNDGKTANQPESLFTSKSLQGGAWLQVVPGKYPIYYAVARANGLFQEHSIRAYPAKRGFVFKQ